MGFTPCSGKEDDPFQGTLVVSQVSDVAVAAWLMCLPFFGRLRVELSPRSALLEKIPRHLWIGKVTYFCWVRHGSTTRCGLWSSMIMRESLFDCLDHVYHAISWYIILEILSYSSIMHSNPCSRSLLTQPDRIWFVAGGPQMYLYS